MILELELDCDEVGRSSTICACQVTAGSVGVSRAYNEEQQKNWNELCAGALSRSRAGASAR